MDQILRNNRDLEASSASAVYPFSAHEAAGRCDAAASALETQLDAVFDEVIARVLRMVSECPARQYRTTDERAPNFSGEIA